MATAKTLIFLFAILAPSAMILAQESNSTSDVPDAPPASSEAPDDDNGGDHGLPVASSASGIFGHFPFKPPKFDFGGFFQIPGAAAEGASGFEISHRHKRSPAEDDEHARQDRAFFRRVVRCNFLTQGGFRCTACNKVRRCYPFNIGTESTCGGFRPYCYNGRCSTVEGPLCQSTTSSTASSSSSSSTSSSSSSSSSGSSSSSSDSNSSGSSSSGSSSSDSSSTDSSSQSG